MKKIVIALCVLLLLNACKKKQETAASTPSVAAKPQLKVKINGGEFTCSSCYSSYHSGNIHGINFAIGSSGDRFVINISGNPTAGNFSLIKFGNPSFNYQKNNVYFRGRGELNITEIDTSSYGTINKLTATFSCKTDTSNGEYFTISEGEINVKL